MRTFRLVAALGVVALAGLGTIAARAANDEPPKIQVQPMTTEQVSMLSQATGQELYAEFCSSCHGADGTGNAAAQPALKQPLPDLTQLRAKAAGEYPELHVAYVLRYPVTEGHLTEQQITTMPSWNKILASTGRTRTVQAFVVKKLVDYIATLQK